MPLLTEHGWGRVDLCSTLRLNQRRPKSLIKLLFVGSFWVDIAPGFSKVVAMYLAKLPLVSIEPPHMASVIEVSMPDLVLAFLIARDEAPGSTMIFA